MDKPLHDLYLPWYHGSHGTMGKECMIYYLHFSGLHRDAGSDTGYSNHYDCDR